MKLRVGDMVLVRTGKDAGKSGKILKILEKQDKVVVEGLNMKTKHVKGREGNPGEKVEFSAPIHISNVGYLDPEAKVASRIGYAQNASGQKVRKLKKSGKTIQENKRGKNQTVTTS